MIARRLFIFLFILFGLSVCIQAQKPWYNPKWVTEKHIPAENKVIESIWLMGDAGKPSADHPEPVFEIMQSQLKAADQSGTVIFLGDNIYPAGMPAMDDPERQEAERRITEQLKMVQDFEGRVVFLPGNHDWENSGENGLLQVKEEEAFIESYLKSEEVFLPGQACPGPAEVQISEKIVLLVLDTQWWLHKYDRNSEPNPCEVDTDEAFLKAVEAALERNKGKTMLVCAHHPMYSYGNHGGYYSWKNHLFPLTMLKKNLYVPLPVLGTAGVFYRKFRGSVQDIPHPRYRELKQSLTDIFSKYPNLIYAAGHEHNLQYRNEKGQHYIVSGAGTKTTYVKKGRKAAFTHAQKGFARLDFESTGDSILRFFEADENGKEYEVYSVRILD